MIHKNRDEIPEQVKAARSLVDFAAEHGWEYLVTPPQPDSAGNPFFKVQLRHFVADETGASMMECFQITWHTRATGGKTYRLFSKIYKAPGKGVWVDAPSLKKIREVIANASESDHV